jgi:Putative abortive phage resistance protein AbiGi, antitoxin
MTNQKSSTLFHFTKSHDSLCGILKNGYHPRYSLEDTEWLDQDLDKLAFPMVCFCDIPLSRLSDHVDFYGRFGLGMKRDWGIKNGFNPISYVSSSSFYAGKFTGIWNALLDGKSKRDDRHFDKLITMAAFHKPMIGQMIISGKPIEKEFYQESEWRYIEEPDDNFFLTEDDYKDIKVLKECNENMSKNFPLKFTPSDIRYIFVKSDSDIPSLVNFINTELDHYPSADLKILLTRIISLESLDPDL